MQFIDRLLTRWVFGKETADQARARRLRDIAVAQKEIEQTLCEKSLPTGR